MKSLRNVASRIQHDDQPCELEYVGFWSRALAGTIDLGLMAALIFPLLQVAERGPERFLMGGMPTLLTILLFAGAAALFYLSPGTTPGMVAISAVVVDERTGCPPSMPQHLGRSLALLLSLVPFGLGCIWAAFQPKKQAWHDKLAGTMVVRARSGSQRPGVGVAAGERHEAASAAHR
jgi:uncharacterized RDD family membrane protein YckC